MPTKKSKLLSSTPIPSSPSSGSLSPAPSSSQLDFEYGPSPPPITANNCARKAEPAPVLYLAVGKDMNPQYMRRFKPCPQILGFARLDNYEYIIDHLIEEPCVMPCPQTQTEEKDDSKKVVYGLLYELHPNALLNLHAAWTGPNGEKMEMAKVTVMRISVDRNLGWGVRRDMREMGWVSDVVIFVGRRGDVDVGLAEGCNEEVNAGIVQGCIWGIPDTWVEENVRRWVKHPVKGLYW